MKKIWCVLIVSMIFSSGIFAADLIIDMQFNLAGKDYKNNYLTFKGDKESIEKDQFDPAKVVNNVTGASMKKSTTVFNAYRNDANGKSTMPGSLRSLLLYSTANDEIRVGDGLNVTKSKDGSIMVRYIHRGTAYEIVTDKNGVITLPTTNIKSRVIGDTDNTISTDFSKTGKVANADWTKIWNSKIADGKTIGKATTGKIVPDKATSETTVYEGPYKISLEGSILKIAAELNVKKK
jgi:hypothetical protein